MTAVIRPRLPTRADGSIYETRWCGPFAMATVAGTSYYEALDVARRGEQKRLDIEAVSRGFPVGYWKAEKVEGLALDALKYGLNELGYDVNWTVPEPLPEEPDNFYTLSRDEREDYWRRRDEVYRRRSRLDALVESFPRGMTFIVATEGHYMVVKNGKMYHTLDDQGPVSIERSYQGTSRVYAWGLVKRITP